MALLLCVSFLVLAGCPAPRYKWEYWLPDKSNPKINIGGYEVVLSLTAFKDSQENKKLLNTGHIDYTIHFSTTYRLLKGDSLTLDSVQMINVDSVFIILLPNSDTLYLNLYCENPERLFKWQNGWLGPDFADGLVIPEGVQALKIGFSIYLINRITNEVSESQKYEFELQQFYDRYWILAQ